MQILQGISAGENLRGDDTAEHLDGADSAEISTADDVFVTGVVVSHEKRVRVGVGCKVAW